MANKILVSFVKERKILWTATIMKPPPGDYWGGTESDTHIGNADSGESARAPEEEKKWTVGRYTGETERKQDDRNCNRRIWKWNLALRGWESISRGGKRGAETGSASIV